MRIRRRQVGAGLGAASLIWAMTLAVAPTAAGASTALCGSTITVNTTLTEDVGPCDNYGIELGANNITLNLNGHTVFGTPNVGDGAGIVAQGRTGVTIRGGTVSNFDAGIALISTNNSLITQMAIKDNVGENSDVASTEFGDGIFITGTNSAGSANNRVIQNDIQRNGPYDGVGLFGNVDDNTVQGNNIQANNLFDQRAGHGSPENLIQEDDGIRLETFNTNSGTVHHSPDRNIVTTNTIQNNGLDGIAVFAFAADNQLLNNAIQHNGFEGNVRAGDGIHIFDRSLRTIVTGNRITLNARNGIRIDQSSIPIAARLSRNIAVNNAQHTLGDPSFDLVDNNASPPCDSNVWTQNTHGTESDPGNCIN